MGIKHFFHWLKNNFSDNMYCLKKGDTIAEVTTEEIFDAKEPETDSGVSIDNFMIDMNGLFHNAAQEVFQYGNHQPPPRLLQRGNRRRGNSPQETRAKQLQLYKNVCDEVERCFAIVQPKKRLILCVDGPAPLSKQNQQRQRRFRSASQKSEDEMRNFDSNCLTPGTQLMDFLTKYIDWFIRKKMSEDKKWRNIEVIFSNEKVPGEGEQKAMLFVRKYGNKDETFCIHGMDADIVMLSLATHMPNYYILRQETRNPAIDFYLIDIGSLRKNLIEKMRWESNTHTFRGKNAINDFVLMCFTVGNDFLPHIPAIEIIIGGIDIMLEMYKDVCGEHGHLTKKNNKTDSLRFSKKSLRYFLKKVSSMEKSILEDKLLRKAEFFPDPLLESNAELVEGKYNLDIAQYRKDYYYENLDSVNIEKACHEYLKGMQWVLTYYTKAVPDWTWRYPYHYAPFAKNLAHYIKTFEFTEYEESKPTLPFIQLLSVLPPRSFQLLPRPLSNLLTDQGSVLQKYCPKDFEVDLSGKRQEWEGLVILPMVDYNTVESEYLKMFVKIDPRDRRRNILGKSFIYKKSDVSFFFRSYYGDFICKVKTDIINL